MASDSGVENEWPEGETEYLGRCPLCGSNRRRLLYRALTDNVFFCAGGRWDMHCCLSCQAAYLDPRPSPKSIHLAYGSYYTHPDTTASAPVHSMAGRVRHALGNGYRNWRYGTRSTPSTGLGVAAAYLLPGMRRSVDSLFRQLPHSWPGARVLDVGFGSGAFLENAVAAGWEAVGVDLDPVVVQSAQSRGLDVRLGGIETLAGQPESFDVITISHVIEHLHDPLKSLRTAWSLLRRGGMLWLATPNNQSYGHRYFGAQWRGLEPPRHLVILARESLDYALTMAGFEGWQYLGTADVAPRMFRASSEICKSMHKGKGSGLAVSCLGKAAALKARFHPERAEFLTVIARKPA